jgi:glycosyltransferase involved in cell wall biosynthesis
LVAEASSPACAADANMFASVIDSLQTDSSDVKEAGHLDLDIAHRSPLLKDLRVAIVHDYLNQRGGAEKVVEVFCRMFPTAPVYTSVFDDGAMGEFWRNIDVRTTFMQRLTARAGVARALLPLYPAAFESFDLAGYDLILSSSSTFAKGVITRPETCHVCYCYTPARYAWMYHEYTGRQTLPPGARFLLPAMVAPLRVWDFAAAQRSDHMIAISHTVAARIQKFYRRSSPVVEPPVDLSQFQPSAVRNDNFLVVARLAAYKRIDIAVEACTRLRVPLIVVGDGPDRAALERLAGPTVRFIGAAPDAEVRRLLSECAALLWPGEEDFGLVPVEAQASGRPVIAYRGGGATETVIDGETGILFHPQTVDTLMNTLGAFDANRFDVDTLRSNAARFDLPRFVDRMVAELESAVTEHSKRFVDAHGSDGA